MNKYTVAGYVSAIAIFVFGVVIFGKKPKSDGANFRRKTDTFHSQKQPVWYIRNPEKREIILTGKSRQILIIDSVRSGNKRNSNTLFPVEAHTTLRSGNLNNTLRRAKTLPKRKNVFGPHDLMVGENFREGGLNNS